MVATPSNTGRGWKVFRTIATPGSADATDYVADQDLTSLVSEGAGTKPLRFAGNGLVMGVAFSLVYLDSAGAIVAPGTGDYDLQLIEVVRRPDAPSLAHLLSHGTVANVAANAVTVFTGLGAGGMEVGARYSAPGTVPGTADSAVLLYREI